MGSSQAAGYADAISQGFCSLKVALFAHLTSNCYPSMPLTLIPACVKAIRNVEAGEPDKPVRLPKGCKLAKNRMGSTYTNNPPAWRLVEACHLDAFIS